MPKIFNTAAVCIPEKHYMVDISRRLEEIKALVDTEQYFTINRGTSGRKCVFIAVSF